ncbi:Pr6Pr family membrane protein [Roseicyclus persicicus]|uniref:Pr6Pr family membrane protein n=1 Tax=Roseicyclus persicicus TaxID=2650661 RepID=A0A7X6GV71_9RHOB|nr:Pr6Pr family membrane protein [Roseibacterium persicicum]NKX42996.1 Pr6Pr family membrane protein [Roseibacterium persicicum]
MFPALSRPARRTALLIALLAAVSVGAQFLHLKAVRAEPPLATALEMARYFTILTHLLVAVTFGVISRPIRGGVSGAWLAALTLSMVMVGLVYHLLLSHLIDFTGLGWWADHGLHTAGPLAIAFWWLVHAPKRRLEYPDLPIFALWPAVYCAYVLARGSVDGVYPYPFLDLTTLGREAVAVNLAGLFVLVLLGGVGMISIGRFADR